MSETPEGARLNWKQACQLLGCKKTHFYKLVRSGKLRGFRIGKRNLWVYEADCRRLMEASACAGIQATDVC